MRTLGRSLLVFLFVAAGPYVSADERSPFWKERDGRVTAVRFSSNGKDLLVGYGNGAVAAVRVSDGTTIWKSDPSGVPIQAIYDRGERSPRYLVVEYYGHIGLLDEDTGTSCWKLPPLFSGAQPRPEANESLIAAFHAGRLRYERTEVSDYDSRRDWLVLAGNMLSSAYLVDVGRLVEVDANVPLALSGLLYLTDPNAATSLSICVSFPLEMHPAASSRTFIASEDSTVRVTDVAFCGDKLAATLASGSLVAWQLVEESGAGDSVDEAVAFYGDGTTAVLPDVLRRVLPSKSGPMIGVACRETAPMVTISDFTNQGEQGQLWADGWELSQSLAELDPGAVVRVAVSPRGKYVVVSGDIGHRILSVEDDKLIRFRRVVVQSMPARLDLQSPAAFSADEKTLALAHESDVLLVTLDGDAHRLLFDRAGSESYSVYRESQQSKSSVP